MCAKLQDTTCRGHLKSISCETVNITELRHSVIQTEAHINSTDGDTAACDDALRHGLILFDILVIVQPIKEFQRHPSAGPRHALNSLFSALNVATVGDAHESGQTRSTEAARPSSSSTIFAEEFIEM